VGKSKERIAEQKNEEIGLQYEGYDLIMLVESQNIG